MDYWKQIIKCPFYKSNGKTSVGCSVGKLNFPDKISNKKVLLNYCAKDWENCPISKALNDYEDRLEQERLYELKHKNHNRRN